MAVGGRGLEYLLFWDVIKQIFEWSSMFTNIPQQSKNILECSSTLNHVTRCSQMFLNIQKHFEMLWHTLGMFLDVCLSRKPRALLKTGIESYYTIGYIDRSGSRF